MKKLIVLLLVICECTFAQKLKIDTSVIYQKMHSFGASDCWSMQMVGKYYPLAKRERIAELLFSQELDKSGNPKGIGLSMWRFNIGAGSTEQGSKSMITNEWRRAESFLENGKYDWTKQAGQQWFLDAAKRHKVDFTLGFLNSAPVSMTKNGISIGSGKLGEWNFDKSKIDEFTSFLAEVSEKLKFDYLSPFNEPQWDWGPKSKSGFGSQEGTPINNADLAWATRKIDEKFGEKNLKTQLTLAETAQIDYLYKSKTNRTEANQDNQVQAFFDEESSDYIGNLKSVEKIICGHSYFTTSPNEELVKKRMDLGQKIQQHNINYWQSEYCVLGDNAGEINGSGMDLGMKTALYVAKVIHADLTLSNASAWHWWLSVSANDYKDGLIYVSNNGKMGENDNNKFDGEVLDSELMWTLGNYSRFVRPNMQRIKVDLEIKNVMASAFKEKSKVVLILVNSADNQTIEIPKIWKKQKLAAFVTSKDDNLKSKKVGSKNLILTQESITTIIITKK
ncbi:glycoside hydrolase [Lacihabitans sp. CCS-44]|uniref:glycoside hydrolase n=1 Tax=Lacihabitans sp. CCS-44 TaxID=2487331 RepID=UPI0020CC71DC|nr:glycoside hydrolase [Lacihabitans sp. CCS-44]MCP9753858.1 glycoside hydrolase [Lacihabitans sp. CCS-44]